MFRMLFAGVALAAAIILVSLLTRPGAGPGAQPAAVNTPAGGQPAGVAPARPEPVAPTRAAGEMVVEVDEATLTRQVNSALAGTALTDTPLGATTVRDVQIQLRGGEFVATGTAQIGPTGLPLSLKGTVQAQEGRPRLVLSDARLSGVALPQGTRQSVEQTMQRQVDALVAGQPMRVTAVTIGSGKLTILGARA